jgi:hypothetical protein
VLANDLLLHYWTQGTAAASGTAVATPVSMGRYSSASLRSEWASGGARWMHVDAALSQALLTAGYSESSYYGVPRGFALVARLEHIKPDGTPMSGLARWDQAPDPMTKFSLISYLRALFEAPPGLYRIIVFVASPEPFVPSAAGVTEAQANAWLTEGSNALPAELGKEPYTSDFICTALVYEFAKRDVQTDAQVSRPGQIPGETHLHASGIWSALQ